MLTSPHVDSSSSTGESALLTGPAPAWVRLLVCAAVMFTVHWRAGIDARLDFVPTYLAAHLLEDGKLDSVYRARPGQPGLDARAVTQQKAAQLGVDMTSAGPFTNHPYLLSAVKPILTRVSFNKAREGVIALNTGCIVWIASEVALLLGIASVGAQLLITLLLAFSDPVLSTFDLGQSSMLALALSLAALRLWGKDTSARSLALGALLAIAAAALKPWCLTLIAGSFALRPLRQAAAASGGVLFALLALPHALYPRTLLSTYAEQSRLLAETTVDAWLNVSLVATLRRCANEHWQDRIHNLDGMYPDLWMLAVAFFVIGSVALSFIAAVRLHKPRQEYVVSALLAVMPFAIMVVWDHYLVFALPLALIACLGGGHGLVLRVAGGALLCELLIVRDWLRPVRRPASLLAEALPLLMIVCVAMLALWLGRRSGDSPSAQQGTA
ncbi:MAG TPA: glycosyltransferase 87 family protein [Polyangiales bacterium]